MIAFIDDHRAVHGVESICRGLQVAPSGYYARLAVRADPTKGSERQQTDAKLRPKIQKVWDDNWRVYGVRKAWRQLCREGEDVARCTVARLMAGIGLRGVVRGKTVKTTIPNSSVPSSTTGPVTVLFRSGAHVKRPFVRRPRVISSPRLSACGAGYRSRLCIRRGQLRPRDGFASCGARSVRPSPT